MAARGVLHVSPDSRGGSVCVRCETQPATAPLEASLARILTLSRTGPIDELSFARARPVLRWVLFRASYWTMQLLRTVGSPLPAKLALLVSHKRVGPFRNRFDLWAFVGGIIPAPDQKKRAFSCSEESLASLADFISARALVAGTKPELQAATFATLLQFSLWGNKRCVKASWWCAPIVSE